MLPPATGPIAITLWRTPVKLTGDLALPLLDTPFEAICAIFITFNEMSTVLHCYIMRNFGTYFTGTYVYLSPGTTNDLGLLRPDP